MKLDSHIQGDCAGISEAELYQKNSSNQFKWAVDVIKTYQFTGQERVLDVGSGDGSVTAFLASQVPQGFVIGVDISKSMVQLASKSSPSSVHKNLLFLEADAVHLPFYEQFDLVVSFSALHWVKEQIQALQCIQQALVPGGKALLLTWAQPYDVAPHAELIQSKKWRSFFSAYDAMRFYFTKEEYITFLNEAGLTPISVETELLETPFQDKNALIGYLKPLVTYIYHLSDDHQKDFLSDLADLLVKTTDSKKGMCIYHLKLQIVAEKP
jgi:trans-aconitate 2-methyltransferase